MQGFILKNKRIKSAAVCVSAFIAFAAALGAAGRPVNHTVRAELPPLLDVKPAHELPTLKLVPVARHPTSLIEENSSLENCGKRSNTFWTLNDSGSGPYLFAVSAEGKVIGTKSDAKPYRGIHLTGRRNIDWEALAADESGNLVIADIGNNESNRRNLCFYIVPEPDPYAEKTGPSRKISFYYPNQDHFPDPMKNFDAESCFVLNGQIYFFTKHWTNTETVLWRVDPQTEAYQAAVPVARFDVRGLVTDAALSPKRDRLAILTYHSVWVFDLPERDARGNRDEKRFFQKPRFRKIAVPITDWQVEGIAFLDDSTLLISSESGALFRLPLASLQ